MGQALSARPLAASPEAPHDIASLLKGMPWAQFEKLVGEAFRQRRFAVLANGDAAGAEDVDLVLRKGGETHLVLCKHWRAERVGVQVLRDLQLTMSERAAVTVFVLTAGTSLTTRAPLPKPPPSIWWMALDWPAGSIQRSAPSNLVPAQRLAAWPLGAALASSSPACPKCLVTMIKRQARRGVHAAYFLKVALATLSAMVHGPLWLSLGRCHSTLDLTSVHLPARQHQRLNRSPRSASSTTKATR
ncbi:MAG: restriction endonuclease [Ideonella sp.]|nr:restriction endonuclease [Ideonella sp.]